MDVEAGPRRRPLSLRRWMSVIGGLSALVALVGIVAGAVAIAQLSDARWKLIDEVDPALLNTQSLVGALLNQETAVRGYAITGDATFLEPDAQGRSQQDAAVARLRQIAASSGRAELASSLADVVARAKEWRDQYADPTIAAVTAGGARAASLDPTAGKGRFDPVRAALDVQRTRLVEARRAALDTLRQAVTQLTVTAFAIGIGLIVLLGSLALWTRRTISGPISTLAGSVRTIADTDLDRRPVGSGAREIVDLAEDVDRMRLRILTELRASERLNAQLDRQTQELVRSNRDLEQFAYVASHDLQEPLRKVSGFCELLRTRYSGQLDERADQYIDFAVDGARRMSRLIADLLAFSRVGRSAATLVELDGEQILEHALRNLAGQLADTGAEVTHDPLPTVRGEDSLLVTVLQNLIGNAVKFHGAEQPRVHVGVARDGASWRFRVTDNGIGIAPEYAEKVFVIFQRLHSKDRYPGTGIGLALCRKIVEYHGGTIWLDADHSPGSAICFTLPVVGEAPGPDHPTGAERAEGAVITQA